MLKFRDFLYLDERTVKRYISSIEQGLVKEIMETDVNSEPSWDFEVSLGKLQQLLVSSGIPAPNVGVKRSGKSDSVSVQITKEPTIDSQFDKLFTYLEPVLQHIDESDIKIWSQITEGQFIYYPSIINLPRGYEDAQLLNTASDLYDVFQDSHKDEKFEKILNDSDKLRRGVNLAKHTNVYSAPKNIPNKNKYYFVAKIVHENLAEATIEDLTFGRTYTLARVESVLSANDKYTVFDYSLKGLDKAMNRVQRRKLKDDLIEIATKPAIVVRPIAIFRE